MPTLLTAAELFAAIDRETILAGALVITPACAAALRSYGISVSPSPESAKNDSASVAEQKTPSAIQKAGDFGKAESVQNSGDSGIRYVTPGLTARFEGVEYSLAHIPDISPGDLVKLSRLTNRSEAVLNGYAVEPVQKHADFGSLSSMRTRGALEQMLLQLKTLRDLHLSSDRRAAIERAIAAVSAL